MPERLLTIKEILNLWPVSRQTLYNERARNPASPRLCSSASASYSSHLRSQLSWMAASSRKPHDGAGD